MKTLLIITFAISILVKHILCLAETPLLMNKNNTKNDTTKSNIHDEKTNNITQNNTIYNISDTESTFENMSPRTITTIVILTIVSIVTIIILWFTLKVYCPWSHENRSAQNAVEFPLRTIAQLHIPDEIELPPRRIEREAHIHHEINLLSGRIEREVHIHDETELSSGRRKRRVRIQNETQWHRRIEPIPEETEM